MGVSDIGVAQCAEKYDGVEVPFRILQCGGIEIEMQIVLDHEGEFSEIAAGYRVKQDNGDQRQKQPGNGLANPDHRPFQSIRKLQGRSP